MKKWSAAAILLALGSLLGAGSTQTAVAAAAASPATPPGAAKAAPDAFKVDAEARRGAAKLDELIGARLDREKVKPAPVCDDSSFLRRLALDVSGKIPTVNDSRKFLSDTTLYKREQAIDRLLDSPGYVNHFTNIWMALLMPEAAADFQKRYLTPGIHRWLRGHLANNSPYDQVVRELVAMPIQNRPDMSGRLGFGGYGGGNEASPMAFYLAKQAKPEDLAANVARLFLGVRIECAQCHDHPFGKWKREEFWSQASFFAGLSGQRNGDFFFGPLREASDKRELNIPNTDRVAQARFLDGKMPRWKFKTSARTTLADWMTAKGNPFFAKALVNRMWAHFFGIGLVDPVDDIVDDNPASHPELLTFLAKEFEEHDFDLKFLIRAITMSRTYQRSSAVQDRKNASDLRLFARMPVKGLTAEQLYETLCEAGGVRDRTTYQQRIYNFGSPRQTFMEKFTDQEKRTEHHTSIPQALTMMNNQLIETITHPDRGEVLGAVVSSTFMDNGAKIEALFLAALSRKPTPDEAAKYVKYVDRGGATGSTKKSLGDVFWVLLNSTEFTFNH